VPKHALHVPKYASNTPRHAQNVLTHALTCPCPRAVASGESGTAVIAATANQIGSRLQRLVLQGLASYSALNVRYPTATRVTTSVAILTFGDVCAQRLQHSQAQGCRAAATGAAEEDAMSKQSGASASAGAGASTAAAEAEEGRYTMSRQSGVAGAGASVGAAAAGAAEEDRAGASAGAAATCAATTQLQGPEPFRLDYRRLGAFASFGAIYTGWFQMHWFRVLQTWFPKAAGAGSMGGIRAGASTRPLFSSI